VSFSLRQLAPYKQTTKTSRSWRRAKRCHSLEMAIVGADGGEEKAKMHWRSSSQVPASSLRRCSARARAGLAGWQAGLQQAGRR